MSVTTHTQLVRLSGTRASRSGGPSRGLLGWRIAVVLAAIAVWELSVVSGVVPATSVPTPLATVVRSWSLLGDGELWIPIWNTTLGWGLGLILCAVIGIPLGIIIGMSRFMTHSTRLLLDFLRTIPAVALIPVLLLTMGSTMEMKVLLVVSGSIWPLLTATIDGVRHVDPVAAETVRSLRLNTTRSVRFLVLPSALPFVFTGFRICAVMALMLTTAGEYLGAAPGIGQEMGIAQRAGAIDEMFVWLVIAGILGVALNALLLRAEKWLLPWLPAHRTEGAQR